MLPFSVTIPATVPQRSEIPEGLMNYSVLSLSVTLCPSLFRCYHHAAVEHQTTWTVSKTPQVSFRTDRHAFTLTELKKIKSVCWISWDINCTEICLSLNWLAACRSGVGLVNSETVWPMCTARFGFCFKLGGSIWNLQNSSYVDRVFHNAILVTEKRKIIFRS